MIGSNRLPIYRRGAHRIFFKDPFLFKDHFFKWNCMIHLDAKGSIESSQYILALIIDIYSQFFFN